MHSKRKVERVAGPDRLVTLSSFAYHVQVVSATHSRPPLVDWKATIKKLGKLPDLLVDKKEQELDIQPTKSKRGQNIARERESKKPVQVQQSVPDSATQSLLSREALKQHEVQTANHPLPEAWP